MARHLHRITSDGTCREGAFQFLKDAVNVSGEEDTGDVQGSVCVRFYSAQGDMVERDIENAFVKDVTALLFELGTGFVFVGHHYHLNVGGEIFISTCCSATRICVPTW